MSTFKYALVEQNVHLGEQGRVWIENLQGMSIHINDSIVFGSIHYPNVIWVGRVIKRSNVLPDNLKGHLRITHTANQFPVSDAPVQPELPVVSFPEHKYNRQAQIVKTHLKNALDALKEV